MDIEKKRQLAKDFTSDELKEVLAYKGLLKAFETGDLLRPSAIPGKDLARFDQIEVHGCAIISDEPFDGKAPFEVEQVDDDADASFFSVYGHYATEEDRSMEGAVTCLADFETKAEAEAYAEVLRKELPKR